MWCAVWREDCGTYSAPDALTIVQRQYGMGWGLFVTYTYLLASSSLPSSLSFLSCNLSLTRRACRSFSDSAAHSFSPICFIRDSANSLSFNASYFCSRACTSSSSDGGAAVERAGRRLMPRRQSAKLSYQHSLRESRRTF